MQKITQSISLLLLLFAGFSLTAVGQENDAKVTDSLARYRADSIARSTAAQVKGVIKDAATGKPLSGMNVSVPEFSAVITDDQGVFTLGVPNGAANLVVKGQGYQQKEVAVKGRSDLGDVLIFEDSYASIYDAARMPFGRLSGNKQSGAVSSLNTLGAWEPSSLEMPDTYLQGRVAGLNSIRRSGTPNMGANLFLRGFNSLYGTNTPLVVLDGMIYDTRTFNNSIISGHLSNPFQEIDLRDIDNFTVLKDASAGMYGTKGANGVIVINSNSNPELATKIDFGAYGSYNYMPQKSLLPIMKAADYRTYLSNVLQSSGMTADQIAAQPYFNDSQSFSQYYAYHNDTDWQKRTFDNGFNTNYNLRVSGGDNVARYVLALGYGNGKGIIEATDLKKYNMRFNGNLNISRKLTINTSLAFAYNEQNLRDQGLAPKTNPVFLGLVKSPLLRTHVVNAQGVESPLLADVDVFGVSNPVSIAENSQSRNQNYRFFGNFNFKYAFSKYIAAQTTFGITADKVRENFFVPRAGVAADTIYTTATATIADSRLGSQVQRLFSVYSDSYVSFNRTFARKHVLSANVGSRFTVNEANANRSITYNSSIDELVTVGNGLSGRSTTGEIGKYRWMNTYLTTNYGLSNKYLFAFNLTADASSRFGDQTKSGFQLGGLSYALLPSGSAAWVVSSEPFMAKASFIELLKLRASYGLTGNDDIGDYGTHTYYVGQNLLGLQGLVRGSFGNRELQWEVNKKLDLGLDLSLFNEKLNITADYFRNTTDNMLTREAAPTVSGTGYILTNNGGMQTEGVEFGMSSRVFANEKWKFDLGFNIATYRNKITKLAGDRMITQYAGANILTQVGMPINQFYGYKTNGVYSSNAEATAAGVGVRNNLGNVIPQKGGDVRFVDVNNDKIIDQNDMQVLGSSNPTFTGGITTGVSYKKFRFDALLTFSKGNELYNYTRRQLESQSYVYNQSLAVNNRWRADGQVTNMPRASYGDPTGNNSFSDRWIEDGSYLRLRTLSASYEFPLNRKLLKYVKVYATGNNLLTFTKYLGYDPEFAAGESPLLQGIDNTLEPQYKNIQLGLRIGI